MCSLAKGVWDFGSSRVPGGELRRRKKWLRRKGPCQVESLGLESWRRAIARDTAAEPEACSRLHLRLDRRRLLTDCRQNTS